MTIPDMLSLTAEQIRTIAREAVADVRRQKITTSKRAMGYSHSSQNREPVESQGKEAAFTAVTQKVLDNSSISNLHNAPPDSFISLEEAKGCFKEAFNKVRKG